jgi:hypothetical protein
MYACGLFSLSSAQSLRYKWLDLMKDTYGSYLVRDVLAIVGGHLDIRALHNPAAGGGASGGADGKPVVCCSSSSMCNRF